MRDKTGLFCAAFLALLLILSPGVAEQADQNMGAPTAISEAIITSSALNAEIVTRNSAGKYREAAFGRLPPTTRFALLYKTESPFADQLTRALDLFGHIAGVKIEPPTTELHLLLIIEEDFAGKTAQYGTAYLQSLGVAQEAAKLIEPHVSRAQDCYAAPFTGERGFMIYGVALIDERFRQQSAEDCMAGVMFTLFGLQNTQHTDRTTDLQRLVLLREIYSIETAEPFRDLTVEKVKNRFEFGRTCVPAYRIWPRGVPGPGKHPPEWCRPN